MLGLFFTVTSAFAGMPIPDADTPQAKVYAARCSVCHALPHPKRLDWEHWRHMLDVMDTRMAQRGMPALSDEDRRMISAYLEHHAR